MGPDCIEGTSDDEGEEEDPTSNTMPELDRVSGEDDCASGETFEEATCGCKVSIDDLCNADCASLFPETPVQNPYEFCECITLDALNAFEDHSLGADCTAGTEDDPSSNTSPTLDQVTG